jgi:hypothetical protein
MQESEDGRVGGSVHTYLSILASVIHLHWLQYKGCRPVSHDDRLVCNDLKRRLSYPIPPTNESCLPSQTVPIWLDFLLKAPQSVPPFFPRSHHFDEALIASIAPPIICGVGLG